MRSLISFEGSDQGEKAFFEVSVFPLIFQLRDFSSLIKLVNNVNFSASTRFNYQICSSEKKGLFPS